MNLVLCNSCKRISIPENIMVCMECKSTEIEIIDMVRTSQ